jgi:DNA-binding GntR family transcriptional regulator
MTPLQRPETLTEAVAKHIRDAIVHGDFAPGSALPEVRLAEELGTSRGTVREALRALEDQGLVDVLPHKGSFVSKVTKRKARELYALRAVLEGFAVRLAVGSGGLDGSAAAAVRERMAHLEKVARARDPLATIEAERALHREIWSHCDNELLRELMTTLQLQTRRLLIYNKVFRTTVDEEIATHQELVAAVLSRDPIRAEAAMAAHVNESAERVLASMPEDTDTEPSAQPVELAAALAGSRAR